MRNCWLLLLVLLAACKEAKKKQTVFTPLSADSTGLQFVNVLTSTRDFNLFRYMYFYNGAGVGAGDFNNDGKVDLFFASNQHRNRLYLNEGDMRFKEVTEQAGIPADSSWSTGVSVADINDDGLLDIYVCRVGQYEVLKGKNQLLLCTGIKNGVPQYRDAAAEWGVDFSGFSTQAAFFDADLDGDLDMYLLNHSVHHNGTFGERKLFANTYHPLSGDRFFRNDGGHFTDATKESGINSSVIGYGLGIAIADINLDGYPDIYIGNDFHENDYLYINQGNGKFKEELTDRVMHTSQFSMGVDVADVNNDMQPEIISVDMLPEDPYILKRSLGEDEYNLFNTKIGYGYNYQYTRNNLQYNRGNGMFSEVGLYAGVSATDWSWSPLWLDFDNDGLKDLFVSNGIPKRMNDMDFVNFVSNDEVQAQIKQNNLGEKELALSEQFPEIKLPNKFFRNKGDLKFDDITTSLNDAPLTFSNGAVYADFDNDGDLDIVVNNIGDPALLYRNEAGAAKKAFSLQLTGGTGNRHAIGATLFVFDKGGAIRTYEKSAVHGFQSSAETPLLVAWGQQLPDSMVLVWPDNSYTRVPVDSTKKTIAVSYTTGLPKLDKRTLLPNPDAGLPLMKDITAAQGIAFKQEEDPFGEFDREQLLPHKLSTEGPAMAIGDINNDGREDFFIGSARNKKSAVFVQQANGRFSISPQPALAADSSYEDVDAQWVDLNKDGFNDLVVASGGNEFYGKKPQRQSRIYLNNANGQLQRIASVLDTIYMTAGALAIADINGDGAPDIFLGARCNVYDYGSMPASYLLLNDGKGGFNDVTKTLAPALSTVGMVTNASWTDLDKDGDLDLLLALEWGAVTLLENKKGQFSVRALSKEKGWWNLAKAIDVDGDGDLDIVAGNTGENFRLKPTENEPVRLYYNDFDGNGRKEQIVTYYIQQQEKPFANKMELERQLPYLKKRFLYAADFAKSSLLELLGKDKLETSQVLTVNYFSNAVLINDGKGNFSTQALPWQLQLSPVKTAVPCDYNADGKSDLLLFGNYYDNNIQMGRNDADFGSLLLGTAGGGFAVHNLPGLVVKGQVRHALPIGIAAKPSFTALLLAKNNDSLQLVSLPGNTPSYR
ncbi:MAG: VCBS repeat-containing protein [Bacteroidetes bacterium]|nr:VCBS repeat-containing protein [Bacteroidota bacterium]